MNIYKTALKDVIILEPQKFEDDRGYFMESWSHEMYTKAINGNWNNFVQDNESCSKKGVFRGFHWQKWPMQQAKLVRVVTGRIVDIVICLIKNSPDYGRYIYVELSGENKRQIYIPRGYAHGFVALEDNTIVNYKVDNYWNKNYECCLHQSCVNFEDIDIEDLKDLEIIISDKDKGGMNFDELEEDQIFYDPDLPINNDNVDLDKHNEDMEDLPESTNIIETE